VALVDHVLNSFEKKEFYKYKCLKKWILEQYL
jgi:hypothetical protein